MWLFSSNAGYNINNGIEKFGQTPGAVLLDVRQEDEYVSGHIPGSINIPSDRIEQTITRVPDKNTPLFVYCLSGGRSARAANQLRQAGYTKVLNIGGIAEYRGERETGATLVSARVYTRI